MDMVTYYVIIGSQYSKPVDNYLEDFYKNHIKWQTSSTQDQIQYYYLEKFIEETLNSDKPVSPFLEHPTEVSDLERVSLSFRHNQIFPKKLAWSYKEFQDYYEVDGNKIIISDKKHDNQNLAPFKSVGCYANFGGNICQLSWCPNSSSSDNEILACLKTMEYKKNLKLQKINEDKINIIQIWDYGSYINMGTTSELKYSLVFENETINHMSWISPDHVNTESINAFKYVNNQSETDQPLYGHLLLLCADKLLRIIPVPKFSKEHLEEFISNSSNSNDQIILKLDDNYFMKLGISTSYSNDKEDRFGNPTCIDWKSKFSSKLIVGYSRGFVALYDLSCAHFTCYDSEHNYLSPIFKKRVAYSSIQSVSFSPLNWQQFNVSVVSSTENVFNFTIDIGSTNRPVDIIRSKKSLTTVLWPRRGDLLIVVPQDKDKIVIKAILSENEAIIPIAGIQSVHFCDYLNCIIVATECELISISLNSVSIIEALIETKDDENFSKICHTLHHYRSIKKSSSQTNIIVDCENKDEILQLYDKYPLITSVAVNPNIQSCCWAAVLLDSGLVNLVRLTNRDIESIVLPIVKRYHTVENAKINEPQQNVIFKSKKTSNGRFVSKNETNNISKVKQKKMKQMEPVSDSENDSVEKIINTTGKKTYSKPTCVDKRKKRLKKTGNRFTKYDEENYKTSDSEIEKPSKDNYKSKMRKIIDSDSSCDTSKTEEMRDESFDYYFENHVRDLEINKSCERYEYKEELDFKNIMEHEERMSNKSPEGILSMGDIYQNKPITTQQQNFCDSTKREVLENDIDWFEKVSHDKLLDIGFTINNHDNVVDKRNEEGNIIDEEIPDIVDTCKVEKELLVEKYSDSLLNTDEQDSVIYSEIPNNYVSKDEKLIYDKITENDSVCEEQDFIVEKPFGQDVIIKDVLHHTSESISKNNMVLNNQYAINKMSDVELKEENCEVILDEVCNVQRNEIFDGNLQNVNEENLKVTYIIEEEQSNGDILSENNSTLEEPAPIFEKILEKDLTNKEEGYSTCEKIFENEIKDEDASFFERIFRIDINKPQEFYKLIPGIDDVEQNFIFNRNLENNIIKQEEISSIKKKSHEIIDEEHTSSTCKTVHKNDLINKQDQYSISESYPINELLKEECICICEKTFEDDNIYKEHGVSCEEFSVNAMKEEQLLKLKSFFGEMIDIQVEVIKEEVNYSNNIFIEKQSPLSETAYYDDMIKGQYSDFLRVPEKHLIKVIKGFKDDNEEQSDNICESIPLLIEEEKISSHDGTPENDIFIDELNTVGEEIPENNIIIENQYSILKDVAEYNVIKQDTISNCERIKVDDILIEAHSSKYERIADLIIENQYSLSENFSNNYLDKVKTEICEKIFKDDIVDEKQSIISENISEKDLIKKETNFSFEETQENNIFITKSNESPKNIKEIQLKISENVPENDFIKQNLISVSERIHDNEIKENKYLKFESPENEQATISEKISTNIYTIDKEQSVKSEVFSENYYYAEENDFESLSHYAEIKTVSDNVIYDNRENLMGTNSQQQDNFQSGSITENICCDNSTRSLVNLVSEENIYSVHEATHSESEVVSTKINKNTSVDKMSTYQLGICESPNVDLRAIQFDTDVNVNSPEPSITIIDVIHGTNNIESKTHSNEIADYHSKIVEEIVDDHENDKIDLFMSNNTFNFGIEVSENQNDCISNKSMLDVVDRNVYRRDDANFIDNFNSNHVLISYSSDDDFIESSDTCASKLLITNSESSIDQPSVMVFSCIKTNEITINENGVQELDEIDRSIKKDVSSLVEDMNILPEIVDYSVNSEEMHKQFKSPGEPLETIDSCPKFKKEKIMENVSDKIKIILDSNDLNAENVIDFGPSNNITNFFDDSLCDSVLDNKQINMISSNSFITQKNEECIDLSVDCLSDIRKNDDYEVECREKEEIPFFRSRENVFQFINEIQDNYLYQDKKDGLFHITPIVSKSDDSNSSIGIIDEEVSSNSSEMKLKIVKDRNVSDFRKVKEERIIPVNLIEHVSVNEKIEVDPELHECKSCDLEEGNNFSKIDESVSGNGIGTTDNLPDINIIKIEDQNIKHIKRENCDAKNYISLSSEINKVCDNFTDTKNLQENEGFKFSPKDLYNDQVVNDKNNLIDFERTKDINLYKCACVGDYKLKNEQEEKESCSKSFGNYQFLNIKVILIQDDNPIIKNKLEEMKKYESSSLDEWMKQEICSVSSNDNGSTNIPLKRKLCPSAKFSEYQSDLLRKRLGKGKNIDSTKSDISNFTESSNMSKSSASTIIEKGNSDDKKRKKADKDIVHGNNMYKSSVKKSDNDISLDKNRKKDFGSQKRKAASIFDIDKAKKVKSESLHDIESLKSIKASPTIKRSQENEYKNPDPLRLMNDCESSLNDFLIQGVRFCPSLINNQYNLNYIKQSIPSKTEDIESKEISEEIEMQPVPLRLSSRLNAKGSIFSNMNGVSSSGKIGTIPEKIKFPVIQLNSLDIETNKYREKMNIQKANDTSSSTTCDFDNKESKNLKRKIEVTKSYSNFKRIHTTKLSRLKVQEKNMKTNQNLLKSKVTNGDKQIKTHRSNRNQNLTALFKAKSLISDEIVPIPRLTRLKSAEFDNCAPGSSRKTRIENEDSHFNSDYNPDGSTDVSNSMPLTEDKEKKKRNLPSFQESIKSVNFEKPKKGRPSLKTSNREQNWWCEKEVEVEWMENRRSKSGNNVFQKIKGLLLDSEPVLGKVVCVKCPEKSFEYAIVRRIM